MKSVLTKILVYTILFALIGWAVCIVIVVFAKNNGNFDTSTLTNSISIVGLAVGALSGFCLALTGKFKKKSSDAKTKGKSASGTEYDLHYDAHFMTDKELQNANGVTNTDWNGLQSIKKTGLVMKNTLEGSKYKIAMKDEVHTLIIGTTGSGKTSAIIDPTIRILAHTAEKPCMVISDPKGELYERHAEAMRKEGYNVVVYDLDNPFASARWNPMDRAYNLYQRAMNIYSEAKKYSHCSPKEMGKQEIEGEEYGDVWFEFNNIAFPSEEMLKVELESQRQQLINEAMFDLRGVAASVCPVDPQTQDKTWEQGAQDFLFGIMIAMLEDSADPRLGDEKLRRDQFNFYNLYKIATKKDENPDNPFGSLKRYCAGRSKISDVPGLTSTVINNAPNTTRSYMGVLQGKISALMQDMGVCYATSLSELDFRDFIKGPTIFFIKIPDHKKERHPLATVCISQLYRSLVDIANDMPGKTLPRHVYFLLDEFGNLPIIPDFDTMITVARSRNIFFEIVIQSYTQLDTKYGKDKSETLKGNFNAVIYLGTEDQNTKEAFSKSCGEVQLTFEEEQISENKSEKGEGNSTGKTKSKQRTTRPLVDSFELGQLPFGTGIVKMFRLPPLKTKYTQFHKTPFFDKEPAKKITAVSKSLNESKVFYDVDKRNDTVFGRVSRWN